MMNVLHPAVAEPVPLVIEPAGEAHLPAIVTIYRDALSGRTASFEDPVPDVAEMRRRLAAVREAGLTWLVASDARGIVAGFAHLRPFRERAAYRETVEDCVYVARHARRHGVGRSLLAALIEIAEAQGRRQMIAVVGDARNRPSVRLHERLGFTPVGFLPGAGGRPGERCDVLLMQRALEAEPPAGRA